MYHNINAKTKKNSLKMVPLSKEELIEKMKSELESTTEKSELDELFTNPFDSSNLEQIIYRYYTDGESFSAEAYSALETWSFELDIVNVTPIDIVENAESYASQFGISEFIPDVETISDSGAPLLGYQSFDGMSFIGFFASDCEGSIPIYVIFYWDGEVIRYYIPTRGNLVYDDGTPFGSYTCACNYSDKNNLFKKNKVDDDEEETLLRKIFREELETRVDASVIDSIDILALPMDMHWESVKADISETFSR